MTPLRLAFSGRSGSGKNTVAAAVFARAGITATHLTFGAHVVAEVRALVESATGSHADPVGAVCETLHVDRDVAAEAVTRARQHGFSRELLQWWGADVRRARDHDYWLRPMASDLAALPGDASSYVTDCRSVAELDLLRAHGFRTVRIEVTDDLRLGRKASRQRHGDAGDDAHVLETELDDVPHDFHVDNHGAVADTAATLLDLLQH